MKHGRSWAGFSALCLGMFAAILDIQVVSSALPRIADALHTPAAKLSWIQTAYLITEVIAIAISGRLSRALSTRGLFAIAMAGFVITSLGCAFARNFETLIVFRSLQGFCGGTIIPTVFAAGYKMFPRRLQPRALLIAGAIAMLAPSLGPLLGGFITEKLSWNWIFLINVPIGVVAATIAFAIVRIDEPDPRAWRTFDPLALVCLGGALAGIEIVLKLASQDGWHSMRDLELIAGTIVCAIVFILRCRHTPDALVDFSPLRSPSFSAACAFSAALGLGLYASVYVLPIYLGFVHDDSPLLIGEIMTVTGAAQLLSAPLATLAVKRLPPMVVAGFGFALFAIGSIANGFMTPATDFNGLVLPQILRGASVLFCILPITNAALDELPLAMLANASAILNLMRNLGGAIGIGLVDTIVNSRPPAISTSLITQLQHKSTSVATFIGLDPADLASAKPGKLDQATMDYLQPLVAKAAATIAFNEAWFVIAGVMLLSLVALPFLRETPAPETTAEAFEGVAFA